MTNKVTMPEPVGYQWLDTGHFRKKVPADADASAFRSLITTSQAEAYANAIVKQALEQAAQICDDEAREWDSDGVITEKSYAECCAKRIRALISPTKNEAEE